MNSPIKGKSIKETKEIKPIKGKTKVIPPAKVLVKKVTKTKILPIKGKIIPLKKIVIPKTKVTPKAITKQSKSQIVTKPFILEHALVSHPETKYIGEYTALLDKYKLQLDILEIEYLQKVRKMLFKYKSSLNDPVFEPIYALYNNMGTGLEQIIKSFTGNGLSTTMLLGEFQRSLKSHHSYLDYTMIHTTAPLPLPVLNQTDSAEDFCKNFYSYLDSCYFYLSYINLTHNTYNEQIVS